MCIRLKHAHESSHSLDLVGYRYGITGIVVESSDSSLMMHAAAVLPSHSRKNTYRLIFDLKTRPFARVTCAFFLISTKNGNLNAATHHRYHRPAFLKVAGESDSKRLSSSRATRLIFRDPKTRPFARVTRAFFFDLNEKWKPQRCNTSQIYTSIHHLAPPYTTLHHHTPPCTTLHHHTPPYTTIHHHTPPYTTINNTTIHHHAPKNCIHHHTPPHATSCHTVQLHTPPYTTIHHHTPPWVNSRVHLFFES
jgi:hypothetical protein